MINHTSDVNLGNANEIEKRNFWVAWCEQQMSRTESVAMSPSMSMKHYKIFIKKN